MWYDEDDRIMKILENLDMEKPECFPVICPICGKKEGHIFFYRHEEGERGGMWTWCSACRHRAHSLMRLPKWWVNLKGLDEKKFINYPEYLEENKRKIDCWVNELMNNIR